MTPWRTRSSGVSTRTRTMTEAPKVWQRGPTDMQWSPFGREVVLRWARSGRVLHVHRRARIVIVIVIAISGRGLGWV